MRYLTGGFVFRMEKKQDIDINEWVENNYYKDNDLGATYQTERTVFKVWAPTASKVALNLYTSGTGESLVKTKDMDLQNQGIWSTQIEGDLKNFYYTYIISFDNVKNETVDPYARTTGVNGNRGMIVDLKETDPNGWYKDHRMQLTNPTDAVIYELHIRDLGCDPESGIRNPGKYISLTEEGTKNREGFATGLDHMVDLGITHVHLLPIYDYASVDETLQDQFNWGYDPENYNSPEGSYATDPYNGFVRINEMKRMIQKLHEKKIGVIMDVVYNHTYRTDSCLNRVVPDYYYRKKGNEFYNGSGCGNELATERPMVRKFIIDSLVYWATQYHLDGFRFDLMGVYDIDTMNEIREALNQVDPSILLYGEGWNGGDSGLDPQKAAFKCNTRKLNGIASFNDDLRDAVKGHVFTNTEKGFVNGAAGLEDQIQSGIVGATAHNQLPEVSGWAKDPAQCVNYTSAHDNLTLWDKLEISCTDTSKEDRIRMNLLSAAIVILSQGIPFFQAGEEILRSKKDEMGIYHENSYCDPDCINSIKWHNLTKYQDVYQFYKGLIALRKEFSLFRLGTQQDVNRYLHFIHVPENIVAFQLENKQSNQEKIIVIFNANPYPVTIALPDGNWDIYVKGKKAGTKVLGTVSLETEVEFISTSVLVQRKS